MQILLKLLGVYVVKNFSPRGLYARMTTRKMPTDHVVSINRDGDDSSLDEAMTSISVQLVDHYCKNSGKNNLNNNNDLKEELLSPTICK